MNQIKLVRIYEKEQPAGYRILVDRLWPRGISKKDARLDVWVKELAPSKELRKWFNHDDNKFMQFKQRYLAELEANSTMAEFVSLVKPQLQKQDCCFYTVPKIKSITRRLCSKKKLFPNYS